MNNYSMIDVEYLHELINPSSAASVHSDIALRMRSSDSLSSFLSPLFVIYAM